MVIVRTTNHQLRLRESQEERDICSAAGCHQYRPAASGKSTVKVKRAPKSQNVFQASNAPGCREKLWHSKIVSAVTHEPVQLHKSVHNKSLIYKVHESLDVFVQRNKECYI